MGGLQSQRQSLEGMALGGGGGGNLDGGLMSWVMAEAAPGPRMINTDREKTVSIT